MRPQSLTLKAFGPYMDETIDFSAFYENNIFLIAGKTGSGKTTLFDGICFALFGKTNGSNREPKEMRSTFADAKQQTSVTFTFRAQNKLYEIVRSPAQVLLKQKGEGTRDVPAKASLRVFGEDGAELQHVTKISEVDEVIEEVVQLNCDQFRQIVMIPQGEFRRFLNADSGEKETILRKLFGTDIYRQLSEKLKEKKKEMHYKLVEKEKELESTLSKAHWTSMKPEIEFTGFAAMKVELNLLQEEQQTMEKVLEQLGTSITELTREADEANVFLSEQQTIQQLLDEKAALLQALESLKEEQSNITALKQQVKKYEEAQQFETLLFKLSENEKSLTELQEKELQTREQLQEEKEQLKKAKTKKQAVDKELLGQESRKEQLVSLNQLKEAIAAYKTSQHENEEQERVVQRLEKELTDCRKQKQQLLEQKEEMDRLLAELAAKQKNVYSAKDQLHSWSHAEDLLNQAITAEDQEKRLIDLLTEKKESLQTTISELETVSNEHRKAKSDWAKVQIQKLSEELIDGEPCPVCGSIEHPLHAVVEITSTKSAAELELLMEQTENELHTLKAKKEVLEQQGSDLEQQLSEQKAFLEQKRLDWTNHQLYSEVGAGTLKGNREVVSQEKNKLENQINELNHSLTEQQKHEEKLLDIEAEYRESQKALDRLTTDHQTEQNHLSQLKGQLSHLSQTIPEQYLDIPYYEAEVATLEQRIQQWQQAYEEILEQTLAAEKVVEQTQYRLDSVTESLAEEHAKKVELKEEVDKVLSDSSFLSVLEVEETIENKEQIASRKEMIDQYEKSQYNVQQNLTLNTQKLEGKPAPQLELAKETYNSIVDQKTKKTEEKAVLQDHFLQNQGIIANCQTILDLHQKNMDVFTEVSMLSDVANGDSGISKLGFERYVLSYFLEEVLSLANQRLQKLSNHRYLFDLNREDGSYKNKTGLEINIYDDHAGGVRNVGTLSGGESFIAALSLALSLSDVVQRQAGGIQIEAIFIDEGFGSLDEDALDQAIEALMQIDGDGKLVGIISHVKELKDRIPDKVLVHALGTGKSQLSASHG